MNNFKTFIRTYVLAYTIVLVFLAIRFFSYTQQSPMWDESVYILMGKYLASSGAVGALEPYRPIVWPAILGLIWERGEDPLVVGHLLILLFSAGNIVLVYMLGRKIFGRGVGAIAAVLLATSPSFYFWGNSLLTEMPASFLGLLSVYLVSNEKYVLSGFTGALSAFTRFVQALNILPLTVYVLLKDLGKSGGEKIIPVLRYVAGSLVVFTALVLIYSQLYGNALQPLIDARAVYTRVSYNWFHEILDCLKTLVAIEGGLVLFALLNFVLSWRRLSKEQLLIWAIALVQLGWVGKYPMELTRFFLTALPYIYLLAANGIARGYEFSKVKKRGYLFAGCLIVLFGLQTYTMTQSGFPRVEEDASQKYVTRHRDRIKGEVWASNPAMVVHTNIKVNELMYYPAFNLTRIADLRAKLPRADVILLDSGNLGCCPLDDPACNAARDRLLSTIKKDFRAEFYYEKPETDDFAGVFRRR